MTTGNLRLSWPEPAAAWVAAAPVGNGRLGAMVFGGAGSARWQLNDATVWSGTPAGPATALREVLAAGAGPERLERVRDAIDKHDHRLAESLLQSFQGSYSQEFLPFADLWMDVDGASSYGGRVLDLDDAVVDESFAAGAATVRRRTWASRPAGSLCVLVTADAPVDVRLRTSSPLRVDDRDGLALGVAVPVDGAPQHEPGVADPLRYLPPGETVDGYDPYAALAVAVDTDGRTDGPVVHGATRLLLVVTSSTSAGDWWAGRTRPRAEHLRVSRTAAADVVGLGANALLADHLDDVRALLGAARVTIGSRPDAPVDVTEVLHGDDDALMATVLLQFGRYLLVSASRPGGPPANLQGIWNDQLRPPWSSNYTININTEMNYWAAEPAALGECHLPLADLLDRIVAQGNEVAAGLYGTGGWVAHHNTDLWGWALPVGMGHGDPCWANWTMGGSWLARHLWDHYEYGLDDDFLSDRAWPVLRGAAEHGLDWLHPGPDGQVRTSPSTSPENKFAGPDGRPESLTTSVSMDLALLRDLFNNCLTAARRLGVSGDPLCGRIEEALALLPAPPITADGRLQEWGTDVIEIDPRHRHISQLVALYPLGQIDPDTTPDLAAAAGRLLDSRGPGAMGWSWAWKIAARARLGDGETARSLFREAIVPLTGDADRHAPVDGSVWGGLLPNLFSSHPPFQIDGNYGFVAALLEMLVRSRRGTVRLLPALPAGWPDGEVRGVRARGGLQVDLSWRSGRLHTARLHKVAGTAVEAVRVRYEDGELDLVLAPGEAASLNLTHPSSTDGGTAHAHRTAEKITP